MKTTLIGICSLLAFISFMPERMESSEYQKYKTIADSIFNANKNLDSFAYQNIYTNTVLNKPRVAVFVGKLFNATEKQAIVIYSTDEETLALDLYQKQRNAWTLVQHQSMAHGEIAAADTFVSFKDFNGDHSNELLILTSVWLIRSGANYKAFTFEKNKLINVRGFEDYPNPEYDEKTKTVVSYMGSGCADMNMRFQEGEIKNDSLITLADISCDCCVKKLDSCAIYINRNKPFKVPYDSSYKYVPPVLPKLFKEQIETSEGRIRTKPC